MKKLIKSVSLLLTFLLVLSIAVVPVSVSAAQVSGDWKYSPNGSTATIDEYIGSSYNITIPSMIDGYTVVAIGNSAFQDNTQLNTVIIPNSVTTIGDKAFDGCYNLFSVTFGNSVQTIGEYAFRYCFSHEYIPAALSIPDSVESIGESAFYSCSNLTSVILGSGIKTIGDTAFCNCSSLSNIVIGFDENQALIGMDAFRYCATTAFTYMLKNELTHHVNYVSGSAGYYADCDVYKLYAKENGMVTLYSTYGGSYVDTFGYWFLANSANGTQLWYDDNKGGNGQFRMVVPVYANQTYFVYSKSVNASTAQYDVHIEFTPSEQLEDSVDYHVDYTYGTAGNDIWDCNIFRFKATKTGNAVIYSSNSSYLQTYGFLFSANKNSNSGFGASLTSANHNAYNGQFKMEYTLTEGQDYFVYSRPSSINSNTHEEFDVHIAYSYTDGDYTYSLKGSDAKILSYSGTGGNITIPTVVGTDKTVTSIVDYGLQGKSNLTGVTIPDSVTELGNSVFVGCPNLSSISIGDGVTEIPNGFFMGLSSLASVSIGDGVTEIPSAMLAGVSSLTSVTLGNSVETIGSSAFSSCSALSNITIPDSVTTIGSSAFSGSGITSITIPDNVTAIGSGMFGGCSKLTSVTIGDGITSIPDGFFAGLQKLENVTFGDGVVTIGNSVFSGCSNLTSVTLGNSVAAITDYLFSNLSKLESVNIPDSVTTIGTGSFGDCSSLESIIIPNSVQTIGSNAFQNCSGLTSLTIGNSVQTIGSFAFMSCTGLTEVVLPDSLTAIDNLTFLMCSNLRRVTIPKSVTTISGNAFAGDSKLTIYGFDSTTADTFALDNNIPFVPITLVNSGSGYTYSPLNDVQTKDAGDSSFGLARNTFGNIELLGVQKKTGEAHDIRFVAVINDGLIQSAAEVGGDIVDYGFVAAKTEYTSTAGATEDYISKVVLDAENTHKLSCVATENEFCGNYGKNAADTKYKYVTLAVKNVPDDYGFVVRFYVKTKSGKVYYANYNVSDTTYSGCVTNYANLTSSVG